jgi:hypothetical protein
MKSKNYEVSHYIISPVFSYVVYQNTVLGILLLSTLHIIIVRVYIKVDQDGRARKLTAGGYLLDSGMEFDFRRRLSISLHHHDCKASAAHSASCILSPGALSCQDVQ